MKRIPKKIAPIAQCVGGPVKRFFSTHFDIMYRKYRV